MSLKDNWIDKIDGFDVVEAGHINEIAHSVMKNEEDIVELKKSKIELAPTLEGNEEDKAPSVKAVNEGLALKAEKTDVEAVEREVGLLNFKIGNRYVLKHARFSNPLLTMPEDNDGTHVVIDYVEPSTFWKSRGDYDEDPIKISNASSVPFDESGKGGYDANAYQVSINQALTSCTINTLGSDVDGTGIAISFDPIAVESGYPIGLALQYNSGNFTSNSGSLRIKFVYQSFNNITSGLVTFEKTMVDYSAYEEYAIPNSRNKSLVGIKILTDDGETFENYSFSLYVRTVFDLKGEFPKRVYSGGTYLKDAFAYLLEFAQKNNADLNLVAFDEGSIYFNSVDLTTMEILVTVKKDETSGESVVLTECDPIPIEAPPEIDLLEAIPLNDEKTLKLFTTAIGGDSDYRNASQITYVAKV